MRKKALKRIRNHGLPYHSLPFECKQLANSQGREDMIGLLGHGGAGVGKGMSVFLTRPPLPELKESYFSKRKGVFSGRSASPTSPLPLLSIVSSCLHKHNAFTSHTL